MGRVRRGRPSGRLPSSLNISCLEGSVSNKLYLKPWYDRGPYAISFDSSTNSTSVSARGRYIQGMSNYWGQHLSLSSHGMALGAPAVPIKAAFSLTLAIDGRLRLLGIANHSVIMNWLTPATGVMVQILFEVPQVTSMTALHKWITDATRGP